MVCGIKGGNARYPCPYCTYNSQNEVEGEIRDWEQYCTSFDRLQTKYGGDAAKAKECCGVESIPILKFRDPRYSFPIGSVHAQIGLREKLIDKIARELLGEVRYKQLQDEWIIPIAGPPKKYHGGTYTGAPSVKIIDSSYGINLSKFPELEPLIPVLQAASNMIHSTFGRKLKGTGYNSIRDFREAYFEMRRVDSFGSTVSHEKTLETITRPNVKLHFLLHHLEHYLRVINTGVEHPVGLGYFSEQVLESSHHNFNQFFQRYVGVKDKLLKSTVKYNALHINCMVDKQHNN